MSLFIATSVLIQNLFAKVYSGSNWEYASSVVQTNQGGYVVAGYTWSFGAGNSDFLLLNLNPDGSLAWAKTYGGSNDDYAYSIIKTMDGEYVVAGWTESFGMGYSDFLILKIDQNGAILWGWTFGDVNQDECYSIIQTPDGGFALAGWTTSFGAGAADLLVLKLNPDGSLAWARTFGGANNDYSRSIIQTPDGGFALAGWTTSFGAGAADLLVLKLNPDGSLAWARTFGGASYEWAYSINNTADGDYVVTGETFSFGMGDDDFIMLKLAPDGSLIWARTFGRTKGDEAFSVIQTSDGGYVFAGWAEFFALGNWDFLVLKVDENGDYSGCVQTCSPTIGTPTLNTSSPTGGSPCSPNALIPTPTITTPTLTITDACPPLKLSEDLLERGYKITCTPLLGGALFLSPEEIPINIYSADGRLAYSGSLKRGETRVPLEQGVYFWITRNQKGKAVVR